MPASPAVRLLAALAATAVVACGGGDGASTPAAGTSPTAATAAAPSPPESRAATPTTPAPPDDGLGPASPDTGAAAPTAPGTSPAGASPSPAAPPPTDDPAEPPPPASAPPPTVPALHPSVDGYPEALVDLVAPGGDPVRTVAVKVADTPERRRHGLMEVEDLPGGVGMLFVFDGLRRGGFWMKNTLVPLSIAFAGADGGILEILDMQPCTADPCPTYDPGVAYTSALEVPAGWFGDVGVRTGWTLRVR